MRRWSVVFYLIVALFLALAGCGKATRESAESRYKSARDKINVAAAKNPGMKATIDAQLIVLDKDFEVAKAKTGDEAIGAIADVARRAEDFEKNITAAPAAPAPGAVPPAGAPPAAPPAPAPGGKLGGAAPPPEAPAVGGKLGGAAPPPVAPAPAPAAPQGGSGFGGQ